MKLKQYKHIVLGGCGLMWVSIILGLVTKLEICAEIGIGIAIATGILWAVRWRCPHCGKFLPKATIDICPRCGKKVDW